MFRRVETPSVRGPSRFGAAGDLFWWCLAAFLGYLAASLPQRVLPPQTDAVTRAVFMNGGFLIAGILLGAMKPQRAWRWGLASILALPLADAIRLGGDPNVAALSADEMMTALFRTLPSHVTHFVPAGVGAYLGAYLLGRRI
jgi:hypothetical protein